MGFIVWVTQVVLLATATALGYGSALAVAYALEASAAKNTLAWIQAVGMTVMTLAVLNLSREVSRWRERRLLRTRGNNNRTRSRSLLRTRFARAFIEMYGNTTLLQILKETRAAKFGKGKKRRVAIVPPFCPYLTVRPHTQERHTQNPWQGGIRCTATARHSAIRTHALEAHSLT